MQDELTIEEEHKGTDLVEELETTLGQAPDEVLGIQDHGRIWDLLLPAVA